MRTTHARLRTVTASVRRISLLLRLSQQYRRRRLGVHQIASSAVVLLVNEKNDVSAAILEFRTIDHSTIRLKNDASQCLGIKDYGTQNGANVTYLRAAKDIYIYMYTTKWSTFLGCIFATQTTRRHNIRIKNGASTQTSQSQASYRENALTLMTTVRCCTA